MPTRFIVPIPIGQRCPRPGQWGNLVVVTVSDQLVVGLSPLDWDHITLLRQVCQELGGIGWDEMGCFNTTKLEFSAGGSYGWFEGNDRPSVYPCGTPISGIPDELLPRITEDLQTYLEEQCPAIKEAWWRKPKPW